MKKFMFAAMAALVLVSCGGAEKKDTKDTKDSKKDSKKEVKADAPKTNAPKADTAK